MPTIEVIKTDRVKPESSWLSRRKSNVHSQGGEDGVLATLFARIGVDNRWAVEFGAWDGLHLSNTAHLISQGWNCVQIEGDSDKFADLKRNFAGNPGVRQINTMIGYTEGVDTLDHALATTDVPKCPDLISIDVDGNDWYVWESLKVYTPRVVVIEFNPTIPNDIIFIQDRNMDVNEGCSAAALVRLGKAKGYELAAVTMCNLIFVRAELFPKLDIPDNSLDAMKLDPQHRIWYGYNGRIYHSVRKLNWHGIQLCGDELQVLPSERQVFGQRVTNAPGRSL